jgi:glycosyltransferase involved in cell wall biosynthesis
MSSASPTVSLLVPVYNAAPFLAEFCRSAQAQTFPDFEVILGNDGSTDSSVEVLSPFLRDPRFRLVEWRENRGLNRAWAALCALGQGEFWCCPGADDVLHPNFLEQRLKRLHAAPHAALVHGPPEYIDEAGKATQGDPGFPAMPPRLEPPRALAALLQHNYINQPSALVRATVTRQFLGSFTGNWAYAPDWYFWILHAATAGGNFVWDVEARHQYRIHQHSLTLDPGKETLRHAEVALVPLCGLAAAKQFSSEAAALWERWRKALYRRWLARALGLWLRGALKREWLLLGAKAFHGQDLRVSLAGELCRHGPGIWTTRLQEGRAARTQRFRVSGLAQINDPIFR